MMKLITAAAIIAGLATAPATAVTVDSINVFNGNTGTVAAATPGQLSIDFGLSSTSSITVILVTEAGDLGGISFDSVVDGFFTTVGGGNPLSTLTLTLGGGATFGALGSIAPAFSTASGVLSGNSYTISFAPNEGFGLELGDVGNGGTDFVFDVSALAPGDTFSLTLNATVVPEPASWALLIGGLGLVGDALRRRRVLAG